MNGYCSIPVGSRRSARPGSPGIDDVLVARRLPFFTRTVVYAFVREWLNHHCAALLGGWLVLPTAPSASL